MKKRWIHFVKSHLKGELRMTTNTRLCSEHFTLNSFTNFHRTHLGFTDNPLLLGNGAVPTIYCPGLQPYEPTNECELPCVQLSREWVWLQCS